MHRGKRLYYRGKYIQEAIFRDLVANRYAVLLLVGLWWGVCVEGGKGSKRA